MSTPNPEPPPERPDTTFTGTSESELRLNAQQLLLKEAVRAMDAGETERFDKLIDRLVGGPGLPDAALVESQRSSRMDWWRITLATLLIVGLIGIVVASIMQDTPVAGDYVPLLSGLAGIAIGWLYSGTHLTP